MYWQCSFNYIKLPGFVEISSVPLCKNVVSKSCLWLRYVTCYMVPLHHYTGCFFWLVPPKKFKYWHPLWKLLKHFTPRFWDWTPLNKWEQIKMFKYGTGPTHRQTKQARLRDGCAPKFFVSLPKFWAPKFPAPKFPAPKFPAPKFPAPKFRGANGPRAKIRTNKIR